LALVVLSVVEQRLDAVRAVLNGAEVTEVAARMGVHRSTVHRWIGKYLAGQEGYAPPPARYNAALLVDAIALAAKAVRIDAPGSGPSIRLRFGRELDARPIWRQSFATDGQPLDVNAVANYIAKYATKTADVPGLPDTRIRHASEISSLRCSAHHKRMVAMAWDLGARDSIGDPRLRLWAHMLGYGGHFLTKSRRYSVTFGYIRGVSPSGGSSATRTANATRGAALSMTPWSWSSRPGATSALTQTITVQAHTGR
jgi:replication initiator protein RepSA/Homeodomain-like domain-containing protein